MEVFFFFQIVFLSKLSKESSSSPVCVNAHNSSIARLALDNRGKKLATGSKKVYFFIISCFYFAKEQVGSRLA